MYLKITTLGCYLQYIYVNLGKIEIKDVIYIYCTSIQEQLEFTKIIKAH